MWEMFRFRCRAARRELWDYAGERLSEGPMEQVECHLNRCAACRRDVRVMREAQKLLSVCREETPPSRAGWSDLRSRLVTEGLAERETVATAWREPHLVRMPEMGSASARLGWLPRLSIASGFAAFLMMAAVTYRLSLPHNERQTKNTEGPPNQPLNTPSRVTDYGWLGLPTSVSTIWDGTPLPAPSSETGSEKPDKQIKTDPVRPNSETISNNKLKQFVNNTPVNPKAKKDAQEYDLKKDRDGHLRYVPNPKRLATNNKSDTPPDSPSRSTLGGDDYIMGQLTPASYGDEAY